MPFVSKSQQRYMFAKHPKMAKEWAEKTDFKELPEKKYQVEAVKRQIKKVKK